MRIRQIYTENLNNVESHLSDVSLTLPDQTYTIKDLFEKYRGDTLDLVLSQIKRKLEFDGQDVDFDSYVDELDANEVYERQYNLTAKHEYLKRQEQMRNIEANKQPSTEVDNVTE